VRQWVATVVVGLNLCPFAGRELENGRVRFVVTDASREKQLSEALRAELALLDRDPSVETTLLIHPHALKLFHDYNEYLGEADRLLADEGWEGVYQIASFHPDYQFADTEPDDVENSTNRSPYPMLHLLREASLDVAIDGYPDVAQIPARNIALMKRLGPEKLRALLAACAAQPAGE
jgi:uncharacterized protein